MFAYDAKFCPRDKRGEGGEEGGANSKERSKKEDEHRESETSSRIESVGRWPINVFGENAKFPTDGRRMRREGKSAQLCLFSLPPLLLTFFARPSRLFLFRLKTRATSIATKLSAEERTNVFRVQEFVTGAVRGM